MEKTKNRMMLVCAAFLCVVMTGLFLRCFTLQVLVKRMRMDNAFTRAVLFDAKSTQSSAKRKSVRIDWAKLYPFGEKRNAVTSNPRNTVFFKITKKFNNGKKRIVDYAERNLTGYLTKSVVFAEWANHCNKVIGWGVPLIGTDSVVEIDDGQLTAFDKRNDTLPHSMATIEFARYCEAHGAAFVYVAAPSKVARISNYSGTLDYSNQNVDEFLASLKQAGIGYIDLRDAIEERGILQHKLFYRTDHHWRAETGLWVASLIAEYLNGIGRLQSDIELLRFEGYKEKIYKDWFLGSRGRKATLARTTPEDFALIYPKFETALHYVIPNLGIDETGDFSIMYDMQRVERVDYYNENPYGAYNYGDKPYIRIENQRASNETKILLIKDSFANCVSPFLSLQCKHMDVVDLRHFTGSIKNFVATTTPDIVIVLYHNSSLSEKVSSSAKPSQKRFIFN